MSDPNIRRSDAALIASLIRTHPEAAERLARVVDELAIERDAHERFEFEARWLLRHAQKLPCMVETYEGHDAGRPLIVKGATCADPNLEPCDYVLADCERLRALLKGEFRGR